MEDSQPHEPGLHPVRLLEDKQHKQMRVLSHWGQASHAVFSEHVQSTHQASQDTGSGGEGRGNMRPHPGTVAHVPGGPSTQH